MYDIRQWQSIDYHRSMIFDQTRSEGFRRAIFNTVKPGDVVLDLGSGSGLLAYFACQSGARKVYAIEIGDIINVAREVCKANRYDDRIEFLNDLSSQVELPERVDVIISETIGNIGTDEGLLDWLIDAKKRLLKQGGRIIPASLRLIVAPIEHSEKSKITDSWGSKPFGLDYSLVQSMAVNQLWWIKATPEAILSSPEVFAEIDVSGNENTDISGSATCTIERSGSIHGLCGWFVSDLAKDVTISNAPGPETSWSQAFMPLEKTLPVQKGDRLEITIRTNLSSSIWSWRVKHFSGGQEQSPITLSQSTFFGQLFSKEQLLKRAKDYILERNQEGEIAYFIFSLMDGTRSLDEIAQHLSQRFPTRFQNSDSALDQVQKMAVRYSK